MALNNENIKILNANLTQIESQIENRENTIDLIDEVKEFQKQLKYFKGISTFETKYEIIRMFIERITVNFDDKTQQFCIELIVKLSGDRRGRSTWYLDKENVNHLYEGTFNKNETVFKPKIVSTPLPLSSTGNSR